MNFIRLFEKLKASLDNEDGVQVVNDCQLHIGCRLFEVVDIQGNRYIVTVVRNDRRDTPRPVDSAYLPGRRLGDVK